jgi:hypothetical protein
LERRRSSDEAGAAKKNVCFSSFPGFPEALEEANQFVNDFVSPEKLEIWKKITGR